MPGHWRRRHRPHWWPADQPWPPAHGAVPWRRRGAMMRRLFLLFVLLAGLSVPGLIALVSGLATRSPIGTDHPFLLLTIVFALVALALAGGARRIAMPLGDVVEAAHRVAEGDLDVRVAINGPRSLRAVAAAFNTMTARLATQERQRRDLLAEIAHELRTPLSVIQGKLEGLLDGLYARDDAALSALVDETRLLARLVEDLRVLSQTESGALALHKEPTEMAPLLHDVVDSFAADAARRGVELRVDIPQPLPTIACDPLRFRQVVSNLMANALRHTAKGRVTIAAAVQSDQLLVSVSDTGVGIAPADLPRIFDRFYRGPDSRGSGLGLTIARDLVRAHGGEVTARSEPGAGTTLSIRLPIAAA